MEAKGKRKDLIESEATTTSSQKKKNKNDDELPLGWKSKIDPKHNKVYYYNKKTKQSTWIHPSLLVGSGQLEDKQLDKDDNHFDKDENKYDVENQEFELSMKDILEGTSTYDDYSFSSVPSTAAATPVASADVSTPSTAVDVSQNKANDGKIVKKRKEHKGWIQSFDEKRKKFFWYNRVKKTSTWTKPSDFPSFSSSSSQSPTKPKEDQEKMINTASDNVSSSYSSSSATYHDIPGIIKPRLSGGLNMDASSSHTMKSVMSSPTMFKSISPKAREMLSDEYVMDVDKREGFLLNERSEPTKKLQSPRLSDRSRSSPIMMFISPQLISKGYESDEGDLGKKRKGNESSDIHALISKRPSSFREMGINTKTTISNSNEKNNDISCEEKDQLLKPSKEDSTAIKRTFDEDLEEHELFKSQKRRNNADAIDQDEDDDVADVHSVTSYHSEENDQVKLCLDATIVNDEYEVIPSNRKVSTPYGDGIHVETRISKENGVSTLVIHFDDGNTKAYLQPEMVWDFSEYNSIRTCLPLGSRVETPYGIGTIANRRLNEGIIEVTLSWGKAYLQTSSIGKTIKEITISSASESEIENARERTKSDVKSKGKTRSIKMGPILERRGRSKSVEGDIGIFEEYQNDQRDINPINTTDEKPSREPELETIAMSATAVIESPTISEPESSSTNKIESLDAESNIFSNIQVPVEAKVESPAVHIDESSTIVEENAKDLLKEEPEETKKEEIQTEITKDTESNAVAVHKTGDTIRGLIEKLKDKSGQVQVIQPIKSQSQQTKSFKRSHSGSSTSADESSEAPMSFKQKIEMLKAMPGGPVKVYVAPPMTRPIESNETITRVASPFSPMQSIPASFASSSSVASAMSSSSSSYSSAQSAIDLQSDLINPTLNRPVISKGKRKAPTPLSKAFDISVVNDELSKIMSNQHQNQNQHIPKGKSNASHSSDRKRAPHSQAYASTDGEGFQSKKRIESSNINSSMPFSSSSSLYEESPREELKHGKEKQNKSRFFGFGKEKR